MKQDNNLKNLYNVLGYLYELQAIMFVLNNYFDTNRDRNKLISHSTYLSNHVLNKLSQAIFEFDEILSRNYNQ